MISKEDLLAGVTLEPVELAVDGLGTVQVRGLTLLEFGRARQHAGDELRMMLEIAAAGLVEPAMTTAELERVPMHRYAAVERIAKRVTELSAGPLLEKETAEELENLAGGGS